MCVYAADTRHILSTFQNPQSGINSGVLSNCEIFIKMRAAFLAPILRVMKGGGSKEVALALLKSINLIEHYSIYILASKQDKVTALS